MTHIISLVKVCRVKGCGRMAEYGSMCSACFDEWMALQEIPVDEPEPVPPLTWKELLREVGATLGLLTVFFLFLAWVLT